MSNTAPICNTIHVVLFRGVRSAAFGGQIVRALKEQKKGIGAGPSALDCFLLAGHAGVSTDRGTTIYGFNPEATGIPRWELMERLKNGDSFPGIVKDDTAVFSAAGTHGLLVNSFRVLLPNPRFQEFQGRLDEEQQASQYTYGYPNGDGDCNCVTWLERLGLPLLSGRMDEFSGLRGILLYPSRRFGQCV